MADSRTIFFAGGGTGGHLYPGIAVAQALVARFPHVRPLFLCTIRPIDRAILKPTGFEFIEQPIVPPRRSVGGLLSFFKSWRETKDLLKQALREHRPAAILGLGGYAAGPAVKYASEKGVPAAILNPDVIPGKANHYLLKYVREVYCQFEATRTHLPLVHQHKVRVTGCPIRPGMLPLPPRADAARRLGLNAKLATLTITGASQGAQTVNDATLEALSGCVGPEGLQGWNVLHLAGRDHAEAVRGEYRKIGLPAVVLDFTADMQDVWAVTDLTVSRAGGSTCAELTALGIASILFPYPFHKDMHQRANADILRDADAAVVLEDQKHRQSNAAQLKPYLTLLLSDATRRRAMADAAKALGRPTAAEDVAGRLAALID